MKEPIWVLRPVVLMAHEQSLSQFGGSVEVRDEGLMDSAGGRREMGECRSCVGEFLQRLDCVLQQWFPGDF